MKNILFADSSKHIDPLLDKVTARLDSKGYVFHYWHDFGPEFLSGALLPLWRLWFAVKFFFLKKKFPVSAIVALGYREKIILSPLARWFKVKIIWFELPENDLKNLKGKKLKFYLKASRASKIIVFSENKREDLLRLGVERDKISLVHPGVEIEAGQTDLFNSLANKNNFHKKFFTIGTIADLNRKQKIEILFQAIKECSAAIPNLQLIIIGDGTEKKNLSWAAKKMKIDTQIWFLSDTAFPGGKNASKKWLENFEIYISVNDQPRLNDFAYVLKAMAAGLPVIAPANQGFEDIIVQNKTGSVIEMDLSEMLARQIIKLYQGKNLRDQLGENARRLVSEQFTLQKMVEGLEKLLA